MKKSLILITLLLVGDALLACGGWPYIRHDSYYTVGTPFYTEISPKGPQKGLDEYLRTLMNQRDELERSDSLYQRLVASYCDALEHMEDPWFYPSKKGQPLNGCDQLIQVLHQCRRHHSGHLLWLQAKCLFQLQRYPECVAFCDSVLSQRPTPYIRARLELWQAGAKVRSNGSVKEADAVYAHYGDELSFSGDIEAFAQAGAPGEMLDFAYIVNGVKQLFQSETLPYPFSTLSASWEEDLTEGNPAYYKSPAYSRCARFCENIARKKPKHQASWYYTAALCAYVTHQQSEAKRLLALAQRGEVLPEEKKSLELLSMKIQLKDHGIRNEAEDKAFWNLVSSLSWYDAYSQFYKEVLYYVLPRFAREGKHDQVLRYAGIFNHLADDDAESGWLLDNVVYGFVDEAAAVKYAETSNEKDRIYDLLGTRCLREMRYAQAADFFRRMSPTYKRNVDDREWSQYWYENHLEPLFYRDPFCMQGFSQKVRHLHVPIPQYKLKFALRMCELEKAINNNTLDPNDRADCMALFAAGMHNSFNDCWILTDFGQREWLEDLCNARYEGEENRTDLWYFSYNPYESNRKVGSRHDFVVRQHATRKAMERRSKKLLAQAQSTYTSPERKAAFYYSLQMFRTVAVNYPTTTRGEHVIGHCDRYNDYYSFKR